MAELETEVKLLKKELQDQAKIHDRLDVAIEKLTDVSNSIHRMLAVHEEKIARQEEAIFSAEEQIEVRRSELSRQIDELHSRITTNTKDIMSAAATQHQQQNKEIQKIKDELISRLWAKLPLSSVSVIRLDVGSSVFWSLLSSAIASPKLKVPS